MKSEKGCDIIKQNRRFRSRVIKLGKQLDLPTKQIQNILNNAQPVTEYVSFSLGPPHYPGAFYGSISSNDFDISKKS